MHEGNQRSDSLSEKCSQLSSSSQEMHQGDQRSDRLGEKCRQLSSSSSQETVSSATLSD